MATEKVRLGPLNRLEPERQTPSPGPSALWNSLVQWAALSCHLCLTHKDLSFAFTPLGPCDRKTLEEPWCPGDTSSFAAVRRSATRGVTVWASGREPASGTASLLGHQNWSPSSEMSSPSHCNPPWSPQGSSFVTRGPFGDRQSGPRNAHCLGHKRISVPTRHSSCRGFSLLTTQHSVIAEDEAIATQSFGFIETMDLHGPRFPQVSHYFFK